MAEPSPPTSWLGRIAYESGLSAIFYSTRDTKILCAQRFVRLFAYGASFLILVHYLSSLGISDERIGGFMTMTLLGDVVISVILTAITDQIGRRRIMALGASLMIASGIVFAFCENYWILVSASIIGVISPSGGEIGPFRAVEESILAHLTAKDVRSDIFAWYTLFGSAGTALGAIVCGWLVQALVGAPGWTQQDAYRTIFLLYAGFGFIKLCLMMGLSKNVEAEEFLKAHRLDSAPTEQSPLLTDSNETTTVSKPIPTIRQRFAALLPSVSKASKPVLFRLLVLFAIDSFASGVASPSWLTYFFTTMHSLQPGTLGTLFFVANCLATVSNLLALPMARRIGPLKTMVFAHLPSTIMLAMIPIPAPGKVGTPLAMALLAMRACLNTVDQAPRQAFVSAIMLPAERTAILGVLNTAKTLAQAGGTGTAGVLAGHKLWIVALSGAGALKALYDLLILWSFIGRKGEGDAEQTRTES